TILLLGALLTGAVTSAAFLIFISGARDFRTFSVEFGIGAAWGLIMFSPIAFAEKFRLSIRRWLARRGSRVQPRVGFIMTLALGYATASFRHHTFDVLTMISVGLVFIGAMFGIIIGIANDDRRPAGSH